MGEQNVTIIFRMSGQGQVQLDFLLLKLSLNLAAESVTLKLISVYVLGLQCEPMRVLPLNDDRICFSSVSHCNSNML